MQRQQRRRLDAGEENCIIIRSACVSQPIYGHELCEVALKNLLEGNW